VNTIGTFGEQHGRLGNQLFQLALLFGVRFRRGHDLYLRRDGESLWDCFAVDVAGDGPPCPHRFDEVHGSCNFDPAVFDQPDGTEFHGYYQSYRYMEGCEDAVRGALRFHLPYRARAEALAFATRRTHRRPLVAIHVRRGDYLNPGVEDVWGNLTTDGYYARAVQRIGGDVTYIVFSDDIQGCRDALDLDGALYADFDTGTSLCLMSICDAVVVANSSFSWWGAFLNPTADVYAPSRWFGPEMPPPNDRQNDIVPPSWRQIPALSAR